MQRRQLLTAAGSLAFAGLTRAQSYPSKPIRLIVPFAPGGSTDVLARALADPLAKVLGQPVVVDNKGGAGGALGMQDLIRAAPDGHTVLMVSPSNTAAAPAMNPKLYNPITDFAPIMNIAAAPWVVAVNPRFPARTYAEFLAEIKRKPGRYSYASSGVGSIIHLNMELFKGLTGTFITHIPYRGAGPAVADVIGGQVEIAVDSPTSLQAIRDGRLIPIVVAAPQRMKDHPSVVTFGEVGLPALNHMSHFGFIGPKALPKPLIDTINAAVKKVLQDPEVRGRIEATGTTVIGSTPEEFGKDIAGRYEALQKVVVDRKLNAVS